MKKDVPVKLNQLIEIDIQSITANAEGIGRYQGFTIFVPEALPGDKIIAEIISVKKSYARALLKSIVSPSPDRIKPVCSYYEECGGCQLMHANYKAQLIYKQEQVESALKHIGNFDKVKVMPIIGMENPYHYRNKAHFPTGKENNKLVAGCYEARSHKIVDIDYCKIQHEEINHLLISAKEAISKYNITTYDENRHSGLLRNILVRHSFSTGQTMIVFVINGSEMPRENEIAQFLQEKIERLVSVQINENRSRGNKLMGQNTRLITGQDHIIDQLSGLAFKVSASSFYQVNPAQTDILYKKAIEFASLKGSETVFDLYCGVGTIALHIAKNAKQVIGIELLPEAIKDAKYNAGLNLVKNCSFITGATEVLLPQLIREGQKADVCIIDPPRSGCKEELLKTLLAAEPDKIIYISCNPATLARDLKSLCKTKYTLEKVQPIDMFPFTRHVECVVLMTRL